MAVNALTVAASSVLLAVQANAPASPQSPPSISHAAEPDSIVIIGSKPTRPAIHNFIANLTVDTEGQIAMFEQPICPASFGLPESYNRVIEQRLREDAARVGLQPVCRT